MEKLIIEGGKKLEGEVKVHGAKNGALPILAATLMIKGESIIHNCPNLSDVRASQKILEHLGCKCLREGDTLIVDATDVSCCEIPENLMREMRSSIVFLGAVSARCGKAVLSSPGGCEIGPRPIDLHISALKELGLMIDESHGCINCECDSKMKGSNIYLSIPSVGATENIMIAASTAIGTTKICNAAREPEITDLARFLNKAGAKIRGAGSSDIVIEGVETLHSVEHTVIPDRILTATYMSAAAITGSDILLKDICQEHLKATVSAFRDLGCDIIFSDNDMRIAGPKRLKRLKTVRTHYFPGFPTDAGPMLIAAAGIAEGTSIFIENIFENRFKFADELNRLGADIKVEGRTAVVEGVKHLTGASVKCTDLRGGAALMVAAFAASGVTELHDIYHIDRGYETPEKYYQILGANIKRTKDNEGK